MSAGTYDVIVVGGGVEGSATAFHLAKDGKKTLLLDQFPLPHSRGSSHGQTRITRRAYSQEFYSHMMVEATQFWKDLQDFTGGCLFKPIGYLIIGKEKGQSLQDNMDALRKSGAPFQELTSQEFKQKYSMLSYPPDYSGVYDPDGGLLRSDRILNTLQSLFKRHGGEIGDGQRVVSVTPEGQHSVTVTTERGQYRSGSVVLCCGPWTSDLTRPLGLALPLQPIRISVCYWKEKEGEEGRYSYERLPTFFEDKCCDGHSIFGVPSEEYPGLVKLCLHHGPSIHPDRRDAVDNSWTVQLAADYVKKHFPGLEPTPAVVESCIYTLTPDKNFILDTHPKWKNIVIGAGFSGHGFKLSPVVGRVLSELAQGKDPSYDLTPFRINRFTTKKSQL